MSFTGKGGLSGIFPKRGIKAEFANVLQNLKVRRDRGNSEFCSKSLLFKIIRFPFVNNHGKNYSGTCHRTSLVYSCSG